MAQPDVNHGMPQRKSTRTPGWVWALVGAGCGFLLLIFLGIVAAIAIPSLLVSKEKAQILQTKTAMLKVSAAMESYYLNHGRYPLASTAEELFVILEKEKAVADLSRRDAWGRDFIIEVPPEGGHYCIISMGQNGLRETQEPFSELPSVNPERGADIVFVDGAFTSQPPGGER
jgi:hypothetical protein